MLQGQTTEVLSFAALRLSDVGRYSCEITVTAASGTFNAVQNQSIILQSELLSCHACLLLMAMIYKSSVVQAPNSVSITSNPATPIMEAEKAIPQSVVYAL